MRQVPHPCCGNIWECEGIDTRFTVTGIDTSVKPDINEETVRRIAIKAANQFSEPGSVTYIATQNIQYYEKPAVLLVIGWETDYIFTTKKCIKKNHLFYRWFI